MAVENTENKLPIVPALGILSESEDRPEYYDRIRILGLETDDEGEIHFKLGIKQKNGEVTELKKRRFAENPDDVKNYLDALEKLKNELP